MIQPRKPCQGAYGNPDQAVIRGGRIGRSAPVGYIDHLQVLVTKEMQPQRMRERERKRGRAIEKGGLIDLD